MQTYEIIVSGRAVHANSADTTLVRTSIGIDKIHVLFDNTEWTAFPVRVTFANGDTIISTSLTLTEIDAPEWAAEAECAIPWEVIQDLGGIRITFQGTDASGNHIITEASGEPLSVVEAGDVGSGTVPSPAPSIDEWNQAYANAMAAANSASGAAESATEAADRANTAAADAEQILVDGIPLMDADTRGGAKLGAGLQVGSDEKLSVAPATTSTLGGVKPDGTTVTIDNDGTIHSVSGYELPTMGVNTKGGAKVGNGLTVSNDTLSANVTGIKGNAEDSYRTGNVNLTPANLGAATQTDMDTAEQAISDLQDAVGTVDVQTDGSLQEQINDLGESVSLYGVVYQLVNMGDITLNNDGYYTIPVAQRPSGTVVAALIAGWSAMYPKGALNITSDGIYVMGASNTNITNLRISYLIRP